MKRISMNLAWLGILAVMVSSRGQADAAQRQADRGVDASRVAEITAMLATEPRGAGAPITDRTVWDAMARLPQFKELVKKAQRLLDQPLPDLPDDLYLDFSRTGNRDRYQRASSNRHRRFAELVLAECLENQGRFLPAIENAVAAIAAEKTWVLPAHDGSLANFRGKIVEIDLAAATTASQFATAMYWLGERLPEKSRRLIRGELERRTFAPFEGMVHAGKPRMWWLTYTNNWNAVCLAGVTGAATTTIEDRHRRAFFIAAAEKYIQYFIDGFTPDGYCSEGLGYWNYGFGHFVLLAENILQATGGKLDLWNRPKTEAMARFARRLEILPGVYPAFADCHLDARPGPRIMAYVSRRFGWGWTEWEEKGIGLAAEPSLDLFEFGLMAMPNTASSRPPAAANGSIRSLRDWFNDAGVLICRPAATTRRGLGAALKGGHNAEQHNHNDVGSFVVAIGKATPLLDPGSEIYTRRTFSSQRYESNVLNSFGHPVPRVAGKLQRSGRSAAAAVLVAEFADEKDVFAIDLRSCYDVSSLAKLTRTFTFSRQGRGSLTVTDEVEFQSPESFETALLTFSPWKQLGENTLLIGQGEEAVQVHIDAGKQAFRVQAEEINEDLPRGRKPIRLGIALTAPVRQATIQLTIVPPEIAR